MKLRDLEHIIIFERAGILKYNFLEIQISEWVPPEKGSKQRLDLMD